MTGTYILIWLMPLLLFIEPALDRISKNHRSKRYYRHAARNIEQIKKLSWQDFELVCADYFQKKGYKVKTTGLGGADDGMDLLITRGGKEAIVQCKHWKGRVGVTVVREMFGLMHANNHQEVFIVALSGYTKAAKEWAEDKPIRLLNGHHLIKSK